MSLINFSCLCMFIVFAQFTESHVLILRDYDDEPFVLGYMDRSSAEKEKHIKEQAIDSNYKPKKTHSKKTVLQYGRHIYHLDNFANMKDLRTKMNHLKPDSIAYDYVDIDNLFRSSDSAKQNLGDYIKDIFIFPNTPVQFCGGNQCDEDLRKFSKHKKYDDDRKHKKMQLGRMKRFHIVNNRHKSKKPQSDSSEEYHEKKKQKASKKKNKKKKKYSSEPGESTSKELGSAEKSSESHKKKKKKNEPKKSSEESVEIKRKKQKKKHNDDDSADVDSASGEKWKNYGEDSKSNEDSRKKKKKIHDENLNETNRKTFAVEDDFFMQGNRIFHAKEGKTNKKRYDFDKRRRLEHFLPKRYHWEPSEIHDLGYYWFNGPKGAYAAPKQLLK